MPKRRKQLAPKKNIAKPAVAKVACADQDQDGPSVSTSTKDSPPPKGLAAARERFRRVLQKVLKTPEESESDSVTDSGSDEDEGSDANVVETPQKPPYVLKLCDRSVDLSQFDEDTPLYPVCRAWVTNKPEIIYKDIGENSEPEENNTDGVELPGPEYPPVPRIPELLPIQLASNKDNINLNYSEAPPPSREQLLAGHMSRWAAVRHAWSQQASRVEARYEATRKCLERLNVGNL